MSEFAFPELPVDIGTTYPDRSAGDRIHQDHHDSIHQGFLDFNEWWALNGGAGGDSVPMTSFSQTAYWRSPIPMENGTMNGVVSGTLYLYPFVIPDALNLTGLATELINSPGAAGSELFLCLYEDDGSFMPGDLAKATSGLPADSTGTKAETFSTVLLPAGIYWGGAMQVSSGAVADFRQAQSRISGWSSMPHGTGSSPSFAGGNDGQIVTKTGLATPPAVFTGGTYINNSNTPAIPIWLPMKVARAA